MELEVYWTQFAEDKLKDIFEYYNFKAGIKVAQNFVNGINDESLYLSKYPFIGQKEELLINRVQEFRYLIYKNYKIIYWIGSGYSDPCASLDDPLGKCCDIHCRDSYFFDVLFHQISRHCPSRNRHHDQCTARKIGCQILRQDCGYFGQRQKFSCIEYTAGGNRKHKQL